MTTILLEQKVKPDAGQLVVELTSTELPASFAFSMAFSHNADILKFQTIKVPGASSTYTTSSSDGVTANVTISGTLWPSSEPFATLIFEGVGSGTFQMEISELKVGSESVDFTNPSAIVFDLPEVPVNPDPDPEPDPGPSPQPEPDPAPEPPPMVDNMQFLTGVYVAAFDRAPEYQGYQHWIGDLQHALDQGMYQFDAFKAVAHSMYLAGTEHGEQGTDLSNAEYVELLYQTVLGREADAGGLAHWTGNLDDGGLRSDLLVNMLVSALELGNPDGAFVRARIAVAQHFANEEFSGPAAIASGFTASLGDVLEGVHNEATAAAALQKMLDALEPQGLSATSADAAEYDWLMMEATSAPQDPYHAGAAADHEMPDPLLLHVEASDEGQLF